MDIRSDPRYFKYSFITNISNKCNSSLYKIYIIAEKTAEVNDMALVNVNNRDRTMVFMDIRNVIRSSRNECGGKFKIDFEEMVNLLTNGRPLNGAYVFDSAGHMNNEEDSKKFHDCLRYNGFRVVVCDLSEPESRNQKGVDVAMACEMVRQAYNDSYDVAIVISGDNDFVPAIEIIKNVGKIVEVASFEASFGKHIRMAADRTHSLSTMPIMCLEEFMPDVSEEDCVEINPFEEICTEVQ